MMVDVLNGKTFVQVAKENHVHSVRARHIFIKYVNQYAPRSARECRIAERYESIMWFRKNKHKVFNEMRTNGFTPGCGYQPFTRNFQSGNL